MTEAEEREALRKTLAGDPAAFEPIVYAYEKLLYSISLRMLGSPEDAADAVQETFLRAYANLAAFRGEGMLTGWLCRIVNNVCLDALRRRRDTVSLSLGEGDSEGAAWDIPDERLDPAALAERKELRRQVREAVDRLPPDFRMPLLLREFGGLRYEEIAQALSLEPSTVKTRIFRARKKLCALLAAEGNFLPDTSSKGVRGGEKQ